VEAHAAPDLLTLLRPFLLPLLDDLARDEQPDDVGARRAVEGKDGGGRMRDESGRRFRPYPAYRDSGVAWLGEIPVGWKIKKLKIISSLQTGITLGKQYEGVDLETRPYLRVANVQDGYISLNDVAEIALHLSQISQYELRENDVVVTEGGDFDKLGRRHVWQGQIEGCLHQNHIFAIRPTAESLDPHFLSAVMASQYERAYFTATSKQSTNLASTNSTKLRNFPIPYPPITGQIIEYLAHETEKVDALVEKVREAIAHLKEYRTALISAAVTGKIDVREVGR